MGEQPVVVEAEHRREPLPLELSHDVQPQPSKRHDEGDVERWALAKKLTNDAMLGARRECVAEPIQRRWAPKRTDQAKPPMDMLLVRVRAVSGGREDLHVVTSCAQRANEIGRKQFVSAERVRMKEIGHQKDAHKTSTQGHWPQLGMTAATQSASQPESQQYGSFVHTASMQSWSALFGQVSAEHARPSMQRSVAQSGFPRTVLAFKLQPRVRSVSCMAFVTRVLWEVDVGAEYQV